MATSRSSLQAASLEDAHSGAAFIGLLNDIERQTGTARCVVHGLNIWPILRFEINYNRKIGRPEAPIAFNERPWKAGLKIWRLRHWLASDVTVDAAQQAGFDALPQADVLFVNSAKQYLRTVPGHAIQPFTDGLRHLVAPDAESAASSQSRLSHITLVNEDPRQTDETFLITPHILPLNRLKALHRLRKPKNHRDFTAQWRILRWVRAVNRILAQRAPDLCLDEGRILQKVERVFKNIHYFDLVLNTVRPKVIFLTSFTGAYHICAAGKRCGIPVIDIQHGGMHAHHPLAANWQNVPRKGYELLPDIFWCWSQRTADLITASLPPTHRAIVAGNPKAALERALLKDTAPAEATPGRPQILVALQYGADDLVKPHVLDAYLRTRDEVDWHFRLHPMGWERKGEAIRILGIEADALVTASRMPLQNQLAKMDLLLTNMSTIVNDARDIGVPAAVCTDQGAAFFDDLLRSGAITHVGDVEEVLASIAGLDLSETTRAGRHARAIELGQAAIAEIRSGYETIVTQCGLTQFDLP